MSRLARVQRTSTAVAVGTGAGMAAAVLLVTQLTGVSAQSVSQATGHSSPIVVHVLGTPVILPCGAGTVRSGNVCVRVHPAKAAASKAAATKAAAKGNATSGSAGPASSPVHYTASAATNSSTSHPKQYAAAGSGSHDGSAQEPAQQADDSTYESSASNSSAPAPTTTSGSGHEAYTPKPQESEDPQEGSDN